MFAGRQACVSVGVDRSANGCAGTLFGNTSVAIKSIESPSLREQEDFARESIFLKACRHPNILQVGLSRMPKPPSPLPCCQVELRDGIPIIDPHQSCGLAMLHFSDGAAHVQFGAAELESTICSSSELASRLIRV